MNVNCDLLQRSPSVISACSDAGVECTPPHKKITMSLDDSLEYSPKVFDSSFSPSRLLSQTLAIESPEVGWKWNCHSIKRHEKYQLDDDKSERTPDSAYAADSSFSSVSSGTKELATDARSRRDTYKERLERQLRRHEKAKAEEKLKQRCAKLQEQLESAGSQKSILKPNSESIQQNIKDYNKITSVHLSSLPDVCTKSYSMSSKPAQMLQEKISVPEIPNKIEIMNDFFNDSDSDCLLLEATQEIESKMNVKTQPAFLNIKSTMTQSTSSECLSLPHASSAPAATTTPPEPVTPTITPSCSGSAKKEKRSSFYMKFLEDDCPDDWFVSLDDVILQATQTKKPRTSLQRYKSLPAETITKPTNLLQVKDDNDNFIIDSVDNATKQKRFNTNDSAACSSSVSKMKRHSSTHTLSPASANSIRK